MTLSKKRLAEIEDVPESAIDLSEVPELDDAFFANARLVAPERPGGNRP